MFDRVFYLRNYMHGLLRLLDESTQVSKDKGKDFPVLI
jgi:hypothetical protein